MEERSVRFLNAITNLVAVLDEVWTLCAPVSVGPDIFVPDTRSDAQKEMYRVYGNFQRQLEDLGPLHSSTLHSFRCAAVYGYRVSADAHRRDWCATIEREVQQMLLDTTSGKARFLATPVRDAVIAEAQKIYLEGST